MIDQIRRLGMLMVEESAKEFRDGDEAALLDALIFSIDAGLRLPPDLAMTVIHRLVSWKSYGVRTLDEAFKVERPGIRLKDRRRRLELQHMVYGRVQEIIYTLTDEYPNGPPLECAYEQVAEELGIGTTLVDELYRSINTPMTHARERYRQSGVADEAKAKILREGIEAQNKIHAEMLNLPSWLIAEYLAIHQPE